MRITIHYDPERNVLYSKAKGVISLEDFMGYYSKIKRMNLKQGYSVLADYTEAKSYISFDEVVAMVLKRSKLHGKLRPLKIAIVAQSDIMFGTARIYGALLSQEKIDVNVFRHRGSALKWLGFS